MGCGASNEAPPKKNYAFRIRMIGGLNLYNNGFGVAIPGTKTSNYQFNGASDPYVKIFCEGQMHETKVILHEQNPVWNEEFLFKVDTQAPKLEFRVFDKDAISSDDLIGKAFVSLNGLLGKEKERECWVPLEGSRSCGEIGFSVIECYRMFVTAKQGTDVQPMDSFSGTSDCYMTIQVGQQERQKTAVKGWTLNPVWNQKFTVYVPYNIPSQLQMILWDKDNVHPDSNMGWVYVPLNGKPEHAKPREFNTGITNAKGKLQFTLEDDTTVEAPPPPAVTAEDKKKFPPMAPQTATFQCRVLGAYNLAAADGDYSQDIIDAARAQVYREYRENTGTSDPFARVECEGQVYDTHHINNTLEPTWNTNMRFIAKDKNSSVLSVKIFDHDIVSNDCIGKVVLPLSQIKPGEHTEMWSFMDQGRGEVGLELLMDYQIKVRVISAEGLPAKDMNGMCDPYLKLSLAGKEYQTRVVRDNRAPWFEEDFRWSIPTLANQKLHIECYDSDLMFFKKGLSEDLIGAADWDLAAMVPGIPSQLILPLKIGEKVTNGHVKIEVINEIPVPQSQLDLLAAKGKEAFNAAVAKLSSAPDFVKTLKPPNYEKKEEAEFQTCDPKIDVRPRFTRATVTVVACRGLKVDTSPIYIGVSLPSQGKRYKTNEFAEKRNPDINQTFEFGVPSKATGGLEFSVFESNKHSYAGGWSAQASAKAFFAFNQFNDGEGLIRGSPGDDQWIKFPEGGEICVRVEEMFRFNIRIIGGSGLKTNTDPFVAIQAGQVWKRTNTVSKDPAKDRTNGIPGKPVWNEQFTIFLPKKDTVKFLLRDEGLVGDADMGSASFNLNDLRRGVPTEVTLTLDKGGELQVWLKEEEKMGLLDRIIDVGKNAAILASKLADEVAGKAAEAVSEGLGKISGALGGLFGK